MSRRQIVGFVCAVLFYSSASVNAVDLEWSETAGLLTYNTQDHWTPNSGPTGPTDSDNVTFSISIVPTPFILLGATNEGNNVNVLDNEWTFTSAGGSNFDTEGQVTIDDTLGTALANGALLTVDAAINWDNVADLDRRRGQLH